MTITTTPPPVRRTFTVPMDVAEWRDSGDPERRGETTLRGHAAVFNRPSEDLGGFREMLAPGAFRAVLRTQPDVRLLLNHDPNYVLARTASGTLELREDTTGLHVFARVDTGISWVADLRTSMRRGDIDQMSFAFTVAEGGDTWAVTEDGQVMRTVNQDGVDGLYDATVATYPAYPQTDAGMRSLLEHAVEQGQLPRSLLGNTAGTAPDVSHAGGGGPASHLGAGDGRRRLAALRARSRAATTTYKPAREEA